MQWDEAVHKRPLLIFAKSFVNKYHFWKSKVPKGLSLQVRDLPSDEKKNLNLKTF